MSLALRKNHLIALICLLVLLALAVSLAVLASTHTLQHIFQSILSVTPRIQWYGGP